MGVAPGRARHREVKLMAMTTMGTSAWTMTHKLPQPNKGLTEEIQDCTTRISEEPGCGRDPLSVRRVTRQHRADPRASEGGSYGTEATSDSASHATGFPGETREPRSRFPSPASNLFAREPGGCSVLRSER